MPVDLKSELTRPLALILSALAVLGWMLFVLSSWSASATQKTQRLQIVELSERTDKLSSELARQVEASGSLAELQAKVGATREDLTRVTQTRSDVQSELQTMQRNLTNVRREIGEADRNLQTQSQKLSDLQPAADTAPVEADAPAPRAGRGSRGGRRWYRRGRSSRSFSVISRSR